jgi:hypothetical protein
VLLSTMLINSDHSALEDAVEAFDSVGIDIRASLTVAIAIFFTGVVNSTVFSEFITELRIAVSFVGNDVAFSLT